MLLRVICLQLLNNFVRKYVLKPDLAIKQHFFFQMHLKQGFKEQKFSRGDSMLTPLSATYYLNGHKTKTQ